LAAGLGNTIGNTQQIQINGELDFRGLYNKNRWLKAFNQPPPPKPKNSKGKGAKEELPQEKGSRSMNINPGDVDAPPPPQKEPEPKDKQQEKHKVEPKKLTTEQKDSILLVGVELSKFSDAQIDSIRKVLTAKEKALQKAERDKLKKEKKLARKLRRSRSPQMSGIVRFLGRLLTMVKRTTVNYTQQSGTILPGYMDSTRMTGINTASSQPGFDFVYGYQPNRNWLEQKATDGRLTNDPLFNGNFQQTYSQNLNIQTTVEPIQDLRIDLTWNKVFTKAHTELYKDTTADQVRDYNHLSPYETGSFNVTYVGLKTLFQSDRSTFEQFLNNRTVISQRLGRSNPYSNEVPDPNNPNYSKGYTQYAQDVMVPAFLAAYTGKSANNVALIDSRNESIKSNPFRYYFPMPNWRLTYSGLSKIAFLQDYVQNLMINHTYSGTLSMNSFVSSLYYQDIFSVGFPSFIDSNSGNFVPFYQVPSVTITEQFNPFIGIDAAFSNNITSRFEFRKSRTISLSMLDYQVAETRSTEYVFGLGYRVKGLKLPFSVFGITQLKNDLNMKLDIGIRDDKSTNHYLALNQDIVTRGSKVITISPSIDYMVSEKLTLRLFYDRRQSIPYVSNSYPITTTRAGIMLRFIFAQ
jgi:cell surface protein SprA